MAQKTSTIVGNAERGSRLGHLQIIITAKRNQEVTTVRGVLIPTDEIDTNGTTVPHLHHLPRKYEKTIDDGGRREGTTPWRLIPENTRPAAEIEQLENLQKHIIFSTYGALASGI